MPGLFDMERKFLVLNGCDMGAVSLWFPLLMAFEKRRNILKVEVNGTGNKWNLQGLYRM